MATNLTGTSDDPNTAGVLGESANGDGDGVRGNSTNAPGVHGVSVNNHGVRGESAAGRGVVGISQTFFGVSGRSTDGVGVSGESDKDAGVFGKSPNAPGVHGVSVANHGVRGESETGRGVNGISQTFFGVSGRSTSGVGVMGESDKDDGVVGVSNTGIAVHGKGGRLAGLFEGDVEVTGDIRLANADCAEDFDVSGINKVEPGTVMVLGIEGALSESQQAYDKRVAGVISGAGNYKPGIVLDKQHTSGNRQPVALMGKVFCKVDARVWRN